MMGLAERTPHHRTIDSMKSEVSSVITTVSLVFIPYGVRLPTPGCGEPVLFSSLDHRGLVITASGRSARAYIVGFDRSISPLVRRLSRAPESWGSMVGAMGFDGLGGFSPAVTTWSGQMNPQNRTLSLYRRFCRLDVLEISYSHPFLSQQWLNILSSTSKKRF